MRPPGDNARAKREASELYNEAACLLELSAYCPGARADALEACARADELEDDATGYVPPRRALWFYNLRPLGPREEVDPGGVGVNPFS